ncbi:MAG: NAD(P)H-binding protein, partial [Pseudomonadales bacterium]|nr:NAD(P)H-binding protein [Pseudomonadales bacterium]
MKVLVIGANGVTATHVIKQLAESDHDPVAMIRDPLHREKFDKLGVPTVLADLEYPIDHAVRGCDAIIFAAGSGGKTGKDKT